MMEKPQAENIAKKRMTWNRSIPKNQTYGGTAVRASNNVPIRNELMSQLTFSKGMRENILWLGVQVITVRRDDGATALPDADLHGGAILHHEVS